MPMYTFKCPRCGITADVVRPVEQRDMCGVYCLSCGRPHPEMQRVPTAASFTIKGFSYANGYGHSQEHR